MELKDQIISLIEKRVDSADVQGTIEGLADSILELFHKSNNKIQLTFNQTEDWAAVNAAEKWCHENGISVGTMQAGSPRGLKRGNYSISKWRNLSTQDIETLDGRMDGDMRNGPVYIDIKKESNGRQ